MASALYLSYRAGPWTVIEIMLTSRTSRGARRNAHTAATTGTAEAVAQPAAGTGDAKPRCWGTYEEGHEACLQCTVSTDCAQAGSQTPAAV